MTVAGNFWANSGTGANRHTKKPKALKSGKRVLIEGLAIRTKIDTANCYTIFPGENVAARILFHKRRGVSVSSRTKNSAMKREKGRGHNGEHKHDKPGARRCGRKTRNGQELRRAPGHCDNAVFHVGLPDVPQ